MIYVIVMLLLSSLIIYSLINRYVANFYDMYRHQHHHNDHATILFEVDNNELLLAPDEKIGIDVHDRDVQSSIIVAVDKLKNMYPIAEKTNKNLKCVEEITELILNWKGNYKTKELAYSTLRNMIKTNGLCTNLDLTELQILDLVWKRINDNVNLAFIDNLKDSLVENLAYSAINPESTRCIVGRVSHLIQCLETVDAEKIVNIVTKDIVMNTIFNKFPVLLREYLNNNPEEKAIYEGECSGNIVKIRNKISEYIDSHLMKEYVSSNLVDEKIYKNETRVYFDNL